jgi:thymidine kinase
MKRAQFARLAVEIFKPKTDTRYDKDNIVSHDNTSISSLAITHSSEILELGKQKAIEVIGIDEAQFFDDELPTMCNELANMGVRVIVAGLDMDYLGRPFGPMPTLMAIAEHVTKLHAICMQCGAAANYSFRTNREKETILLGEKNNYEPRCRRCYVQS